MNPSEAKYWAHKLLPADAQMLLKDAAQAPRDVRTAKIDFANAAIRAQYPKYFKE